jgi:hypothetical protein
MMASIVQECGAQIASDFPEPCSDAAHPQEKLDKKLRALSGLSECSTKASSFSNLSAFADAKNTEDTDDDKVARTSSTEFMCPHCKVPFTDAEALGQHDKCMNMPTVDKKYQGVNIAGEFSCQHCNQRFDTEKALTLHCKFIHSQHESQHGYTLVYEFNEHSKISA